MSYDFIVEDSDETRTTAMCGWETVVFQVVDEEVVETGEDIAAGLEALLVERYFGSSAF